MVHNIFSETRDSQRLPTRPAPAHSGRCHRLPRRGVTYVVVLGATLIVATLGLGGLLAVRAQSRSMDSMTRVATARQNAMSAIELGFQEIATNTNWRTVHKNDAGGVWFNNLPIGNGTYSLKVVNPNGPLDNAETDPVVLTGTGKVNNAIEQQMIEVTLVAQLTPFTCLKAGECAGGAISLGTTTLDGINQIICSNASGTAFTTGGAGASVYAYVEAVGSITGTGYFQTPTTSGVTPRTMPDPVKVFDYYVANGTAIDINALPIQAGTRSFKQRVLSPNSNPFGATNPQGIYVIDCQGQAIAFSQNRIVGTVVLINPMGGTNSYYQNQNNHVPAVANFPVLMVKGDFSFRMNSSALGEAAGLNFNPSGTPYPWPSGGTDTDVTDTYPNLVEGLIYVSGNFQTQTAATIGLVVVNGTITHQNGSVYLKNSPLYFSNPPPGFYTMKMVPLPGSWKQITN